MCLTLSVNPSAKLCVLDGQRPKSTDRSSPSLAKRIKVETSSEEIPVKLTNKIRHDPSKLRFLEGLGLVTVDKKKGNPIIFNSTIIFIIFLIQPALKFQIQAQGLKVLFQFQNSNFVGLAIENSY